MKGRPSCLVMLGLLALAACARRAPSLAPPPRLPQVLDAGRVVLECEPPDSSVTLDGVPMGLCSDYARVEHGLQVGSGLHHLTIRHLGRDPYETDLAPDRAGERVHVELRPESYKVQKQ